MLIRFQGGRDPNTYFVATENGRPVPKFPTGGVAGGQELRALEHVTVVPAIVESAMSPDVYSYSRASIRRNLYRIPIS
jgi:hypothetical protein